MSHKVYLADAVRQMIKKELGVEVKDPESAMYGYMIGAKQQLYNAGIGLEDVTELQKLELILGGIDDES
jgi:hypothetical protein